MIDQQCPHKISITEAKEMKLVCRGVVMPPRVAKLPQHQGFPVPFFAAIFDGVPDFRVADADKRSLVAIKKLCWICGQKITYPELFCFIGGPKCMKYHTFGDGPMHYECASFSVQVCPYLIHDDAKRASTEKLATKAAEHASKVVTLPSHTEEHPTWFYLCQVREYKFHHVPAAGHKVFQVDRYEKIDQWRNGKITKANIKESEIV